MKPLYKYATPIGNPNKANVIRVNTPATNRLPSAKADVGDVAYYSDVSAVVGIQTIKAIVTHIFKQGTKTPDAQA